MVKFLIVPIVGSFFLVSCMSPETREAIDRTSAELVSLRAQLDNAVASGAPKTVVNDLQTRVDKTEGKLANLEEKGAKERQEVTGQIQTALSRGDYLGAGLVALTTIIGGLAGWRKLTAHVEKKVKAKVVTS